MFMRSLFHVCEKDGSAAEPASLKELLIIRERGDLALLVAIA
jgi:hypothetical protein